MQTTDASGTAASWRVSPRSGAPSAHPATPRLVAARGKSPASGCRSLGALKAQTPAELSRSGERAIRGQDSPLYLEFLKKASPTRPTHSSVLGAVARGSTALANRSGKARDVRRGELEGIATKYKGISNFNEFHALCDGFQNGQLKVTELEDLYLRGKISTSVTYIKRYVYGLRDPKHPDSWLIQPGQWKAMTEEGARSINAEAREDTMLLGLEAEEFMVHFIVRCHRRKKGLTEREIKMWARAQVAAF